MDEIKSLKNDNPNLQQANHSFESVLRIKRNAEKLMEQVVSD